MRARSALLLDTEGSLAEGPGFDVVIVKDGVAPSPARTALPGITRRTALELAEERGLTTALRDVSVAELRDPDEGAPLLEATGY